MAQIIISETIETSAQNWKINLLPLEYKIELINPSTFEPFRNSYPLIPIDILIYYFYCSEKLQQSSQDYEIATTSK